MKSPFDVLPKVQPGDLPHEPYPGATAIIGRAFDATDTTYKFYWFLSLLAKAFHADPDAHIGIPFTDLGLEMVVQGWYTRRQFRLWFGHQDRLQQVIDHLGEISSLEPGAESNVVRAAAAELPWSEVKKVLGYVPYRFLSPWFQEELQNLGSDSAKNDAIRHFAVRSRRTIRSSPYYFGGAVGKSGSVILDQPWVTFLQSNFVVLRAFALISLARFLEIRNPGVPGIINKLEKPQERDLTKARIFWNEIIRTRPLRCIYSGAELTRDYEIDHFIPWTFVTHDLIWNLIPTTQAANASKSDRLPSLSHYLDVYVESHYDSLHIIQVCLPSLEPREKRRVVEEVIDQYTTLTRGSGYDVRTMPRDQFQIRLKSEIRIQADLAKRLKFPEGWIWRPS